MNSAILTVLLFVSSSAAAAAIQDEIAHAREAEQWNTKIGRCADMKQNVGAGKTYTFPTFPPRQHSPSYGTDTNGGPRHCTWTFETMDNCKLILHTTGFDRGHLNDCNQQYIEISDENETKRSCGINEDLRNFNATGNRLTLRYYQRSGHGQGSPYMRGYVQCVESESSSKLLPSEQPNGSNGGHVASYDPEHGSSDQPKRSCGQTHVHTHRCNTQKCCRVRTIMKQWPLRSITSLMAHNVTSSELCTISYEICAVTGQTERLAQAKGGNHPASEVNEVCETTQMRCASTGGCRLHFIIRFADLELDEQLNCSADRGEICTGQINYCLSRDG